MMEWADDYELPPMVAAYPLGFMLERVKTYGFRSHKDTQDFSYALYKDPELTEQQVAETIQFLLDEGLVGGGRRLPWTVTGIVQAGLKNVSSALPVCPKMTAELSEEIFLRFFNHLPTDLSPSLMSSHIGSVNQTGGFPLLVNLASRGMVGMSVMGMFWRFVDRYAPEYRPSQSDVLLLSPAVPAVVVAQAVQTFWKTSKDSKVWVRPVSEQLLARMTAEYPELAGLPYQMLVEVVATLPVPDEWLTDVPRPGKPAKLVL